MDWKEFFKRDTFAVEAGVELDEVEAGYAVASLRVQARHLNAGGVTQGGVVFTLADFAMAAAANAHGQLSFSIQSDIRFLESTGQGDTLTATAREVLLKRTIGHYRAEVVNSQGVLVGVVDSVFHRKN